MVVPGPPSKGLWPGKMGCGHMDHFLAYIDPGSGSLIIQAVIASVVAIPFFFREHIGRIVRVVRHEEIGVRTEGASTTDRSA